MSDHVQPQRIVVPSRRDFLKTSGLAVAGTGLAAGLSVARSAHAAGDDTIKIGLVGCGGRGTGAANQALHVQGNVKLIAMGDAFEDRLKGSLGNLKKDAPIAPKIDVPEDRQFVGFDAYKKVLEAGVDLVILATPPGFRPIHLAAAVEADKHVFMEKPVAVDGPGVRAVLAATAEAKKKNLALGVGLQRHHQKSYLETIKRLQDGEIGDIICTRVYWNSAGVWVRPRQEGQTDMEYQMRNWYYFNWLCGDHIVEQHIHNLDVSNWLKGSHPIKAERHGRSPGSHRKRLRRDLRPSRGRVRIRGRLADVQLLPSHSRLLGQRQRARRTAARARRISAVRRSISASGDKWRYRGDNPNPYQVEHDDLFASIRSGNPINEGEYGATSTMTAILGRLCTYSGKMITWEEAINSDKSLGPKDYAFDAPAPTPFVAVPGQTQVI